MTNKGILFIVSGPSGCGKGTILAEILKDNRFYYSVSATTRQPRNGEENGVNYHFLAKNDFEELILRDGLLEYAQYCDNYYGTLRKPVEDNLNAGKHVILEIEVQGAMNVMKKCPDAVSVFILPPSLTELRRRLNKRGTEAQEVIDKRMSQAEREIRMAEKYDYIMVNGPLDEAVNDLRTIIRAAELNSKNSVNMINEVLEG